MKHARHSANAPGRSERKGITIFELQRMFPDNETAEQWFIKQRWPSGVCCPECGSLNVGERTRPHPSPFRCRECRKDFSTKTGTLMHASNLSYRTWAFAIYLTMTNLKSVSSMKLHRELGISQKSAWHLMHRIRENWQDRTGTFDGPVEADETFIGGRRCNMSNARRAKAEGRGPVDMTAVAGVRDRATRQVAATVVGSTDLETLQAFVGEHAEPGATVYTDESGAYRSLPFDHETVTHSAMEFVRGDVHTNGIESFWSMLKRAHKGTFHKLNFKHLDRYVREFAGRHNMRELDTREQMEAVAKNMATKRLPYKALVRDNGLSSGARAA